MSANTKIEWCDHTFNPWIGCTKISPGCDRCYAEVSTPSRTMKVLWGAGQLRQRTSPGNWNMPLRWNAQAGAFKTLHGRRQRVFCASLADVFDNAVDREWRDDLATLILNTPALDWLLLTKRIGNAGEMLGEMFMDGPPTNVWVGATIVNQSEADRDIPKLLAVPARVRFLSMEPLLGPVDLRFPTKVWGGDRCNHCCNGDRCDDRSHYERRYCPHCRGTGRQKVLDWVIVGGESGARARPMHPDWTRSLRDQCAAAGVPFHLKQWGEWCMRDAMPDQTGDSLYTKDRSRVRVESVCLAIDGTTHADIDKAPKGATLYRLGKKFTGRKLDGRIWDGFPS